MYFTAVNKSVLELSDATMPFWSDGYLYVPSTIFTGVSGDLGVGVATISGEEGAPGFRFGSFSLLFDDRSIYLVKGSRMLARYAVADFSNRPGAVFRQMQRECARFTER